MPCFFCTQRTTVGVPCLACGGCGELSCCEGAIGGPYEVTNTGTPGALADRPKHALAERGDSKR